MALHMEFFTEEQAKDIGKITVKILENMEENTAFDTKTEYISAALRKAILEIQNHFILKS